MRRPWIGIILVVLLGCGAAPKAKPTQRTLSAVERSYPALRWVPFRATYVMASAHAADVVTLARELLLATGILLDAEVAVVDGALTRSLGFNPLSADDLASAGIALDRSAAVFSSALLPTFVLPVSDEEALDRFLGRHVPPGPVEVRRYREHEWFSWRFDPDGVVQWARWPGFVAVHIGLNEQGKDPAWLDDMLAGGPRISEHPDFARTLRMIGSHMPKTSRPGVIGMVRPNALSIALAKILPRDLARDLAPCLRMADVVAGPVALAGHVDWGQAHGIMAVELEADALAELRSHLAPPPPGFLRYRARGGFYASLAVDPSWLEALRARAACPLMNTPLPSPAKLGLAGLMGVHVAVEDVDIRNLEGRGALHLNLRETKGVEALLDLIPQRKLFERSATVAGKRVKVIEVPLLVSMTYVLDRAGFTGAMGKSVMEQVLAPSSQTPPPQESSVEIASMAIHPQRLGHLTELIEAWAGYVGLDSGFVNRHYRRLSRYRHGSLHLRVRAADMVLEGAMQLAQ